MNERMQSDRDLAALRKVTARDIPELETTIQDIRRRGLESGARPWTPWRNLMALLHSVRTRPVAATALVAALVVVVGMIVPVSYERVVGQDVDLTLAGKELGPQEISAVAKEFKAAMGASAVAVEATADEAGPRFVLRASLPKRSAGDVRRSTAEFTRTLAATGCAASVQVTPRRERVRYPAAAYALDQIISISVDGKSAAALEAEIRDRLAQAGVPNAYVSVTDRPGGGREVRMAVERTRDADSPAGSVEPVPQVVLTKDGAPITGGEGQSVKIQKRKMDGATSLVMEVASNGSSAKLEVPNVDGMSDAQLAETLNSQLRQAGLDLTVTVTGGKISVEKAK